MHLDEPRLCAYYCGESTQMKLGFPLFVLSVPPRLRIHTLAAACLLVAAAGCSTPKGSGEINDPYEAHNREVHAANIELDRALVRPSANGFGKAVPVPVQNGLSNFADNLSLPGVVVNNLLQFDIGNAIENTVRFALNTTVGLAGVLDPAAAIGLQGKDTDFGATLHVWGVPEGAYLELPVLGPSTERDAVGKVVDLFIDPLNNLLPSPEKYIGTAAKVASRIGDRSRYSGIIDGILYDSADSYAQARLLYLQNRRYDLGDVSHDENFDPYEDPYAK